MFKMAFRNSGLLAAFLVAGSFALGGCGGSPADVHLVRPAAASTAFETLTCLTEPIASAVRVEPDTGVATAWHACQAEFRAKVSALGLTPVQEKLAFASILAYALAPYGSSVATSLNDLLADDALDCDNYALLTGYLARILGVDAPLRFVGFHGGAVGNHAQVFVENELLLDPTIGLIARIGFDEALQGKPVAEAAILVFRQRSDAHMDGFAAMVRGALATGAYRPSDLLYFYPSFDQYLKYAQQTPPASAFDQLVRTFPTPAVAALYRDTR